MDIKNNISVLIDANQKGNLLFPFDLENSGCLTVSNVPNIIRILKDVEKLGVKKIFILSDEKTKLELYNYLFPEFVDRVTFINNLADLSGINESLLYIRIFSYYDYKDLENIVNEFYLNNVTTIMIRDKKHRYDSLYSFGVSLDKGRKIAEIYGHPRDHYVDNIVFPIFVLKKDFVNMLKYIGKGFENVVSGGMPDNGMYIENLLNKYINMGKNVNFYHNKYECLEIDSPWGLLEANNIDSNKETHYKNKNKINKNIRNFKSNVVIGNDCIIDDNVIFEGNCKIGDNVTIKNGSIIGKNVIIGNHSIITDGCKILSNTIIGNNCKIGFNAEIGGVIMDGVSAVHNCEISGVIGKYVDIGAGSISATLRFDDKKTTIKTNGMEHSNNFTDFTFIGNYTRTGVNNIFYPGVRIGSYSAIAPGAIVDKDIEHNTILFVEQTHIKREWNSKKYNW